MLALQVHSSPITLARYVYDASVLPPIEDTLPLAEAAPAQVIGLYSKVRQRRRYGRDIPADPERYRAATLAGKDAHGLALAGHRPAFSLPPCEGWARRGVGRGAGGAVGGGVVGKAVPGEPLSQAARPQTRSARAAAAGGAIGLRRPRAR